MMHENASSTLTPIILVYIRCNSFTLSPILIIRTFEARFTLTASRASLLRPCTRQRGNAASVDVYKDAASDATHPV